MQSAHLGWRSRRYLPHYDRASLIQHIVFGLWDSLPPKCRDLPIEEVEALLDSGAGGCLLGQPINATILQDCLLYYDDVQYRLMAWCIMPNHVHVLVRQFDGYPLHKIVHAWKSVSAHRINKSLNRNGPLWRREYFDRYMRDDAQLGATIQYIERNPLVAGLVDQPEDWTWSSLRMRLK